MSEPAAITAQLVDVRNVAAHKSVRLELHVPAEQAGLVMAAFGWPTMADPVPVALARLHSPAEPIAKPTVSERETVQKERRPFSELPYSQQAAMRCQEPDFKVFLYGTYPKAWGADNSTAGAVRILCRVNSRAEIIRGEPSGDLWEALEAEYYAWQRGRR